MDENRSTDAAVQKRLARRRAYRLWPLTVLVDGWCLLQVACAIESGTIIGGGRGNSHEVTLTHEPIAFWFSFGVHLIGLLLGTIGPIYMIWDDRRDRARGLGQTSGPPVPKH